MSENFEFYKLKFELPTKYLFFVCLFKCWYFPINMKALCALIQFKRKVSKEQAEQIIGKALKIQYFIKIGTDYFYFSIIYFYTGNLILIAPDKFIYLKNQIKGRNV